MGSIIIEIKILWGYLRYSIILLYYLSSPSIPIIKQDIDRWRKELNLCHKSYLKTLIFLLSFKPQFRNLFYFRCKNIPNSFKIFCPPDKTLTIADCENIAGGGLYFVHANSTHIYAKSIGYGCIIRQLTTFGVKSTQKYDEIPTIGCNVDFGANVTCIGNITIGDNAVIGAGSVVIKNVPPNAIVAGNPAKIIGYKQEPCTSSK